MPKFIESAVIESGDLFQAAERLDASLNLDLAVRKAITVAVKQSSKSRAQVADDLARLTGHRVSEHMLHSFSSESKEGHRFPGPGWPRSAFQLEIAVCCKRSWSMRAIASSPMTRPC